MAWIARLDARARQWPPLAHWSYLALKWALVALGGFALVRLQLDRAGLWPLY